MECTVSWTGNAGTRSGMGFMAETGSGHVVAMDGAPDAAKPENGGQNLAPPNASLSATRPAETRRTVGTTGFGGTNSTTAVLDTAYFAHSAWIVSKSAALLGKTDDAARYDKLYHDI